MKRHLPFRFPSLLVFLVVIEAGSLVGQEAEAIPEKVRLYGRILDAASGAPVFAATVRTQGAGTAYLTDTLGLFVLEVEAADEYVLTASQLGYRNALVTLPATAPREFTTLLLEPDPIELEGLQIVVDRFERRRRLYVGNVRVLNEAQLQQAPALSAWDVVQLNVPSVQQCNDDALAICALRRGRLQRIAVCIDEERAWGGATDLERYFASDLYAVEVLDMGREVRVYTREFMADLIESGRNLTPLAWACG